MKALREKKYQKNWLRMWQLVLMMVLLLDLLVGVSIFDSHNVFLLYDMGI
jgi:hypothetical protein